MHGFFHFKTSEFLSYSYSNVTHSFAPRPLIFYLQQEVLKFNDIFVSWSSPKTDPETNFLNLENIPFENVSISQ